MNIDLLSNELLVHISYKMASNATENKDEQLMYTVDAYKSLRRVSKSMSHVMDSELGCVHLFNILGLFNTFGPEIFFRNRIPRPISNWNIFLIQGHELMKNWSKDLFSYTTVKIDHDIHQSFGIHEDAELINYCTAKKTISRIQVGREGVNSFAKADMIKFSEDLEPPNRNCYPFAAHYKNHWAINEREGTISIFNEETGMLVGRLNDLKRVLQVRMKDNYLFVVQEEDNVHTYLLRIDMDQYAELPVPKMNIEKILLSKSNKPIGSLFFSENRISFVELSGVTWRLLSAAIKPTGVYPTDDEPLNWISTQHFLSTSHITPMGNDFILCNHPQLDLHKLKIVGNKFVHEMIINKISLQYPSTLISEIYYKKGKIIIFYFSKSSRHFNLVTYDLRSKNIIEKKLCGRGVHKSTFKNCLIDACGKIHFSYLSQDMSRSNIRKHIIRIATLNYEAEKKLKFLFDNKST